MSEDAEEIDIFKVLSHPLRRRLLIYIAEKESASYKDLIKIVSKPGALYHHLKLLGDLIYQDEQKLYHLTRKGRHVYEFLLSGFFVPEDRSIHRILTPRFAFERIEGVPAIIFVCILIVSNVVWYLNKELLPVFILVAPIQHTGFVGFFIACINWPLSCICIALITKLLIKRRVSIVDLMMKMAPVFILVNLYPVMICGQSEYFVYILYILIQFFSLLFSISVVSVVARVPLRSALAIVIMLHYGVLLVVVGIIILGPVSIILF